MRRSFENRILGGVCGGISAGLRVNAWILRVLFVVLAVVSGGILAALYVALWWAMPQESLTESHGRAGSVLFTLLLIIAFVLVWAGRELGWLTVPNTSESVYVPLLLLMLSLTFILHQLRA